MTAKLKRQIKYYLQSFDDDSETAETRHDETIGAIREIQNCAIELGLPRVAEVCSSVKTRFLALSSARIVLSECLSLLKADSDLLTVKQAADRLGVSQRTIYDLVACGRLRCQRVGVGRGTIRIQPSDLDGCITEPVQVAYNHLTPRQPV